jgi:GntR family transcriptional regulator
VKTTLRKLIVSGAMSPDEKLPSVRELASQLVINPNTIQRAYRELEQEGYIISIPGKGSYANLSAQVDEGRKKELLTATDEIVAELLYLGVTPDELDRRIREKEAARHED